VEGGAAWGEQAGHGMGAAYGGATMSAAVAGNQQVLKQAG
jgi:hypothetical protein